MLKNKFFQSFLVGALVNLAFAPFNFFPAAIISLSAFYFLLEGPAPEPFTKKKFGKNVIFWLGFFYGFGYFLAGIYWISISLLVDAKQFAWLIPFALTFIPSALALYFALFAVSYKFIICKYSLKNSYQKIIIFSLLWLLLEVLRSVLFTGFPWNLLGYIWMFDVRFAQSASIFGVYGSSFFAVLVCLFPVLFLGKKLAFGDKIFSATILLLFVVNIVYGFCRVDDSKLEIDGKARLRMVQANIKQEMKWDPQEKFLNFKKHIELTNSQDLRNISAVIWSETSVPYVIDNNPELLDNLRVATPKEGVLITGAIRATQSNEAVENVWNSVFVLDQNGVVDFYDKHHLVPFGEYVPLQKFLPFVEKITDGAVGFSEGDGAKTITIKPALDGSHQGFSFSSLVCYEVIFSKEVLDKNSMPNLFVNLTNDAWFGRSSGPYQHLAMSRMRSIEYGIPLARVAGTGISAFADPFGRIVKKIGLNEEGIIDVDLIKNLEPTFYAKNGDLALILLVVLSLCSLFIPNLIQRTNLFYQIRYIGDPRKPRIIGARLVSRTK